jgi:hypothetical protein
MTMRLHVQDAYDQVIFGRSLPLAVPLAQSRRSGQPPHSLTGHQVLDAVAAGAG